MNYPDQSIELDYRDMALAPVKITISSPRPPESLAVRDYSIRFEYLLDRHRLGGSNLKFLGEFLADAMDKMPDNVPKKEIDAFWEKSSLALEDIAKWLLFHSDIVNSEDRDREYTMSREKQDLPLSIRDGRLVCDVADEVMREEMKLGRIVALQMAYKHSVIHGFAPKILILAASHFPENVISAALDGMVAEGLAIEPSPGSLRLSTSAQKQWEQMGSMSQCAFIIGPCDTEYNGVIDAIKHELRLAKFHPIFQEHEEPGNNIYADIFDYLRETPLVVIDISENKPNVFLEIGYAMALNKRIIGLIREDRWDCWAGLPTHKTYKPVPFDVFPIRFTKYKLDDVESLKQEWKELRERIAINKKMIEASQSV